LAGAAESPRAITLATAAAIKEFFNMSSSIGQKRPAAEKNLRVCQYGYQKMNGG
jgi:hypothetical protein